MSATDLIPTGMLMGLVHVLTGPDHLSALATLSGTSSHSTKQRWHNFFLGVKWGMGHSLGLIVVGGTLIALEEGEGDGWIGMDDGLRTILEGFVGVFMLGLGWYGLHKAFRHRANEGSLSSSMTSLKPVLEGDEAGDLELGEEAIEEGKSPRGQKVKSSLPEYRRESMEIISQMSDALNRDGDSMRAGSSIEGTEGGAVDDDVDDVERRIFNAVESLRRNSDSMGEDDEDDFLTTLKASAKTAYNKAALSQSFVKIMTRQREPSALKATNFVQKHAAPENSIVLDPTDDGAKRGYCVNRCCVVFTPGVLALLAGIVHGVAGPGGVLGVIPAVQLKDAKLASIYLGTFCITSTMVMGCFAAFYGSFSRWLAGGRRSGRGGGGRVFVVEAGSALLSFVVGIVWLALLSVGKLDDVFP